MATDVAMTTPTDNNTIIRTLRRRRWDRKTSGAVFGLVGGIVAPLFGSLFTAIGWFSGPTWHGFAIQRCGTVLLFLTIPLLLFGAHCLDLIERDGEPSSSPVEITNEPSKEGDNK